MKTKATATAKSRPRFTGCPAAPMPHVRSILHGPRVQPRLKVGAVNDPAEAEADRMAEEAMRMPELKPEIGSGPPLISASSGDTPVRRLCTECEEDINRKPAEETVRRQEEEKEENRSLCLKSFFGGEVMFSALSQAVLDEIAVINEDDNEGLTMPVVNDVWYDCDGFWYRPASQWFKIPNHCRVEITNLTAARVMYEHCCNLVASIFKDGPRWTSDHLDNTKRNPFSGSRSKGSVHRKETAAAVNSTFDASGAVANQITSSAAGRPLPASERAFFEPRFGRSFDNVRVHTGGAADHAARSINARAFTLGSDIAFAKNEYSPGSSEGRRLMAHELAHTVQQKPPSKNIATVRRAAIYSGRILDEGSCEHLACNSKWACEDDAGLECPDGTRNAHSKTKKKYRPLFTCDTNCEAGKTCSDTDNWMAIPKSRFTRNKCGQDLVICANSRFTHGKVRDRSEVEAWEVGHGVQDGLMVSPYATFRGTIYADENDAAFQKDPKCRAAEKKSPKGSSDEKGSPQDTSSAAEGETEIIRRETPPANGKTETTTTSQPATTTTPTTTSTKTTAPAAKVCLTFDDGPQPGTNNVLSVLQKHSAPATFFLTGKNMEPADQAQAVRMMLNDPLFQVGNHTYSHSPEKESEYKATYGEKKFPNEEARQELRGEFVGNEEHFKALMASEDAVFTGFELARLPGDGRNFPHLIAEVENLGLKHFGWQFEIATNAFLGTRKWVKQNWEGIANVAAEPGKKKSDDPPSAPGNYPKDQNVVLFHDRHWAGAMGDRLDDVLTRIEAKGIGFGRLNRGGGCG